jgi:hypothetical protein
MHRSRSHCRKAKSGIDDVVGPKSKRHFSKTEKRCNLMAKMADTFSAHNTQAKHSIMPQCQANKHQRDD